MKKRSKIIILIFMISVGICFFLTKNTKLNAESEIKYSQYLNIGKNCIYNKEIQIRTLDKSDINYLLPVGEKMEELKGEYAGNNLGFKINNEFYKDFCMLKKEGLYYVEVYATFFNKKLDGYIPSGEVKEKFYIEIKFDADKIKLTNENFYFSNYVNADEFVLDFSNHLTPKYNLSSENINYLKDCFNYFNNIKDSVKECSLVLSNDSELRFKILSTIGLNNKMIVSFNTPITIDLNYYNTSSLNKKLSEIVNPFLDINVECEEHIFLKEINLLTDPIIEPYIQTKNVTYTVKSNISSSSITTVQRKIIVFNSYNNDIKAPTIIFDNALEYDYVANITYESLFNGISSYDEVVNDNINYKTCYSIKNASINVSDYIYTNFNEVEPTLDGPGEYELKYYTYDLKGNKGIYTRKLIIKDVDAPKVLFKYNYINVTSKEKKLFEIKNYYRVIDNSKDTINILEEKEWFSDYGKFSITVTDLSNNAETYEIIVFITDEKSSSESFFYNYKKFWKNIFA